MSGKSTVYIAAFMLSVLLPYPASAQITHHHDVTPPPRPQEEVLQKINFYKWKSRDVIAAFKAHGLEVAEVEGGFVIGAVAAAESTIFLMPSHGNGTGGVVSGYESEDKLREALRYYTSLNIDPGSPAWRIYRRDNILLLISGRVPEEKAREYERVMMGL